MQKKEQENQPCSGQAYHFCICIKANHISSGLQQVHDHWAAHDAKPYKTQGPACEALAFCHSDLIQKRTVTNHLESHLPASAQ